MSFYEYFDNTTSTPYPSPPTIDGCTLVTDGPMYDKYCTNIPKANDTCLLYECPNSNTIDWPTSIQTVDDFFEPICPYKHLLGAAGKCCPTSTSNYIRGYCQKDYSNITGAP